MNNHSRNHQDNRFAVGEHVICYRRGDWWWAEFYVNRRQNRISLKTRSKKEARCKAAKIEIEILTGTHRPAPLRVKFADVIENYKEFLETEDRQASTIKRYAPELDRWAAFLHKNGVHYIDDITLSIVEKYRSKRKQNVAPATLLHESTLIKQVLNYALERDLIANNPLKNLKLKRLKQATKPTYTLQQVNQIVAAATTYADLFEMLAFSGLRIGEAKWITWKDVEFDPRGDGGLIHVRAKPGEWQPKDRDDRTIPMHPRLARMLLRRRRKHRFIFTAKATTKYPLGDHQISERHVLTSLKRILVRLNIPGNTVHGFRHFFVSQCANNGVEPFKLIQWTGHSDLATVLRYYSLTDEDSRKAMNGIPFGDGANSEHE